MNLASFLVKAKKNTYTSGAKPRKLDDGFEELIYQEGDLFYRDRWSGSNQFGGQEVLMRNLRPVWIMNYYGGVLSKEVSSDEIYKFLRKAMSFIGADRPFRGPYSLKEGDFEYIDKSKGTIERFRGTEIIKFKGEEVYKLEYHGGAI